MVWQLQAGSRLNVFETLCNFYQNAVSLGCHSVLISGEDFENFLIDSAAQLQFEQMLIDAGFDDFEWVVVRRDPLEYFRSIYAELSKHGVCINAIPAAISIARSGWFAVSTTSLNNFFAVDLVRLLGAFRARTRGNITVYEFTDFVSSGFIGADLLRDCFGFDGMDEEDFASCLGFADKSNNFRLSEDMVEANYLRSFLGFDSASALIEDVERRKSLFFRKECMEAALEILSKNCVNDEN